MRGGRRRRANTHLDCGLLRPSHQAPCRHASSHLVSSFWPLRPPLPSPARPTRHMWTTLRPPAATAGVAHCWPSRTARGANAQDAHGARRLLSERQAWPRSRFMAPILPRMVHVARPSRTTARLPTASPSVLTRTTANSVRELRLCSRPAQPLLERNASSITTFTPCLFCSLPLLRLVGRSRRCM